MLLALVIRLATSVSYWFFVCHHFFELLVFLCEVVIRSICGSILLIILCSFRVTSINCRSVCCQSSGLKQKHAGYDQIMKFNFLHKNLQKCKYVLSICHVLSISP